MAQIIINIPDADLPRVLNAFSNEYGYDRYVEEGGSLGKAAFAKSKVVNFIKDVVKVHEHRNAVTAAVSNLPVTPDLD